VTLLLSFPRGCRVTRLFCRPEPVRRYTLQGKLRQSTTSQRRAEPAEAPSAAEGEGARPRRDLHFVQGGRTRRPGIRAVTPHRPAHGQALRVSCGAKDAAHDAEVAGRAWLGLSSRAKSLAAASSHGLWAFSFWPSLRALAVRTKTLDVESRRSPVGSSPRAIATYSTAHQFLAPRQLEIREHSAD